MLGQIGCQTLTLQSLLPGLSLAWTVYEGFSQSLKA